MAAKKKAPAKKKIVPKKLVASKKAPAKKVAKSKPEISPPPPEKTEGQEEVTFELKMVRYISAINNQIAAIIEQNAQSSRQIEAITTHLLKVTKTITAFGTRLTDLEKKVIAPAANVSVGGELPTSGMTPELQQAIIEMNESMESIGSQTAYSEEDENKH